MNENQQTPPDVEKRQSVLRPEQGKIPQIEQDSILNAPKRKQIGSGPTAQILVEFNQWKKALIQMIKSKASLQYYDENNYQFVLPPPLVRLVWDVTINERIAAQDKKLPKKDRIKKAYEGLRSDLDSASKERLKLETARDQMLLKRQQAALDEASKKVQDAIKKVENESSIDTAIQEIDKKVQESTAEVKQAIDTLQETVQEKKAEPQQTKDKTERSKTDAS